MNKKIKSDISYKTGDKVFVVYPTNSNAKRKGVVAVNHNNFKNRVSVEFKYWGIELTEDIIKFDVYPYSQNDYIDEIEDLLIDYDLKYVEAYIRKVKLKKIENDKM